MDAKFTIDAQYKKLSQAAIKCTGSFVHTGPAENCVVAWYIGKSQWLGGADFKDWSYITAVSVSVGNDISEKTYIFSISGLMPVADGVKVKTEWSYDCFLRLLRPGNIVAAEKRFDNIYSFLFDSQYDQVSATFD